MFSLFSKGRLSAFIALLSLGTTGSLMAWGYGDSCDCNRMYVGGFGGGLYSLPTQISQMGTAFFTEAQGGPLAVYAHGKTSSTSTGFGGIQFGYEWLNNPINLGYSDWNISPTFELEAFWYSHKKQGHLANPTDRLDEHDFLDSFQLDSGVYLANAIFSINNSSLGGLIPYVGGGVGATRIYLHNAQSIQTSPPEVGVNHFNTKPSDSTWAFAAQIKTGLRYQISESFHVFGEYRYLYVDANNYVLGSTVSPGHPATSPWNIKVRNIQYNAFVFGIQYEL